MKQAIWMTSLIGSFALSACGGDMGDSLFYAMTRPTPVSPTKSPPPLSKPPSNIAKSLMARLKPTNAL